MKQNAVQKILIIDDDPNLRKTLSGILGAKGYEALTAGDGAEGLALLERDCFNLALIDLRLPDMPGLEVLNRVKADCPSTEAIIITGNATLDSAIEATNKGAFSYLTKPYEIDQLLLHIKRAIEKQQAEQTLRDSEERFRKIFEEGPLGMALIDRDYRFIDVNNTLCGIFGYTRQELAALGFMDVACPEDADADIRHLEKLFRKEMPSYKAEKRYIRKDGETIWVDLIASPISDETGKPLSLLLMMQNITERKILDEKLEHDAFHDALTDLPNRAYFVDHLTGSLARSKRQGDYLFAVLYLDLDHFKDINDSLGHPAGDELLIEISKRLKDCTRPYDMVARLGGDEFAMIALLIEDVRNVHDLMRIAERLQKEISRPIDLQGHEVYTTASIGIAIGKTGYDSPENILRDADTAMYQAKTRGRACSVVFDEVMHAMATERLRFENDLRRAVEKNEFALHYQPITALGSGEITGFEALARWPGADGAMTPPAEFIPVAEEIGLIIPIGRWVLYEACRQMRSWHEKFPGKSYLKISVNVSTKQFTPDLADTVKRVLSETGLGPGSLKLEITESAVMNNPSLAASLLSQLKSLNIHIHMDDFGTGYSSLSSLHKFPIDAIKIDRSFIESMTLDKGAMEIVKTIITMAHNLNKEVIAEGVETDGQAEELRKLKCDYLQGYLFSKPLDAKAAETLLAGVEKVTSSQRPYRQEDSLQGELQILKSEREKGPKAGG